MEFIRLSCEVLDLHVKFPFFLGGPMQSTAPSTALVSRQLWHTPPTGNIALQFKARFGDRPNLLNNLQYLMSTPTVKVPLLVKAKENWEKGRELVKKNQRELAHRYFQYALFRWIEEQGELARSCSLGMFSDWLKGHAKVLNAFAAEKANKINSSQPETINPAILCMWLVEAVPKLVHGQFEQRTMFDLIQFLESCAMNQLMLEFGELKNSFLTESYQIAASEYLGLANYLVLSLDKKLVFQLPGTLHYNAQKVKLLAYIFNNDVYQVRKILAAIPKEDRVKLVNTRDISPFFTFLIVATMVNMPEMVQVLLEHGAAADLGYHRKNDKGSVTAASVALSRGCVEVLKCLLKYRPDLVKKDCEGASILYFAILHIVQRQSQQLNNDEADYQILRMLILGGATLKKSEQNIKKVMEVMRPDLNFLFQKTPKEIKAWEAEQEQKTLGMPVLPDDDDLYSETKAAEISPTNNKNPTENIKKSYTRLRLRCYQQLREKKYDEAKVTLAKALAVRQQIPKLALPAIITASEIDFWQAVETGNLAAVRKICTESKEQFSLINSADPEGKTLLMAAMPHIDILKFLIQSGKAQLNLTDPLGRTLLHYAVTEDNFAVVSYLLTLNPEKFNLIVDAMDDEGQTPLHYAAKNNYVACGRLLLQRGANYKKEDLNGQTVSALLKPESELKQIITRMEAELAQKLEQKESERQQKIVQQEIDQAFAVLRTTPRDSAAFADALAQGEAAEKHLRKRKFDLQRDLTLAELLGLMRKDDQQQKILISLRKKFPQDYQVLSAVGFSCLKMKNYVLAESAFNQILIMLDPRLPENQEKRKTILVGLQKCFRYQKKYQPLAEVCRELLLAANNVTALLDLVLIDHAHHSPEEILARYDRLAQQHPHDLRIMRERAWYLFKIKDYDAAMAIFETIAARQDMMQANSWLGLARCYTAKKDFVAAERHYQLLTRTYPEYYSGQISFAMFCSHSRDYSHKDVVEQFEWVLSDFPREEAHLKYFNYLWRKKKYVEALTQFKIIVANNPDSLRPHLCLINNYVAIGQTAKAIEHCRNLNHMLLAKQNLLLQQQNEPEEALQFFNHYRASIVPPAKQPAELEEKREAKREDESVAAKPIIPEAITNLITHLTQQPSQMDDNFQKSPTLMLSVPYYAVSYGFKIEGHLAEAIKRNKQALTQLSVAKLNELYGKYFLSGKAENYYQQLVDLGLTEVLFPGEQHHAWIKEELRAIDEQIALKKCVPIEKIYAIILGQEVAKFYGTADFYEQMSEVVEDYGLSCDAEDLGFGMRVECYARKCQQFLANKAAPVNVVKISNEREPVVAKVEAKEEEEPVTPPPLRSGKSM